MNAHPLAADTAKPASSFTDKALRALERIEYRRILSGQEMEDVYRLRYEAYRREGLIEANASGTAEDEYDSSRNCQLFGLYIEGRLASSIRIHHATPENRTCPTMSHFPRALDTHFDNGISFIDSSRFCAEPEFSSQVPLLPLFTTRLTAMASIHFGADYNLMVVRPEHAAFYKRYFGMKLWQSGQKVDWFAVEVDLYANDRYESVHRVMERLPFFRSTEMERERLFQKIFHTNGTVSVRPTAAEVLHYSMA